MLSTGAIVGLAMIAALGIGLLIFGSVRWLCRPKRKNRRPVGIISVPDTLARKSSFQSFRSTQSHTLHPLETAVISHGYGQDEVSPESTYRVAYGQNFLPMYSNTAASDLNAVAVEPWPGRVAELPDKRYTLTSSK